MDTTKTSFGLDQINNPTPEYANWIFRGYFIISKAVIGYLGAISALKGIGMSLITFTVIILTITLLLDPIVLGFSKLFGVVPEQADPAKSLIATDQIDDKGDTQAIKPVVIAAQGSEAAPPPSYVGNGPVTN